MNIGIIGLGRIGQVHLKAINNVRGVDVIAVSDINEKVCGDIARAYNTQYYSTDYQEIISNENIDAIWVCSPSNQHYLHVSEALKHGKYVFCEKPLETKIEKIQSLIALYPDIDKKLMVGFNRRFDPDFARIKENLSEIGKPTILKIISRDPGLPSNLEEYIRSSGGIFKDMTIHDLDMARFIVGDEVEQVYAIGVVNYDNRLKGLDIDTSLITLKFRNGMMCNIDNSRVSAYGYDQRLEVHGDKGMIKADNHRVNHCSVYSGDAIKSSIYKDFFLERYKKAYQEEVRTFYDCVREKRKFPVRAYDALKALELAEACEKSLKENKAIKLDQDI